MRKTYIAALAAAALIAVGCGSGSSSGGEGVPADVASTVARPADAASAKPKPKATTHKPVAKPTTRKPKPVTESYANCAAMRKAHPNGVPSGHRAYRSALDRDHDGRACER